jgi:predicted nucleic acid-binding protein
MYLLDTNIVSMLDPRRHAQAPALIGWLERNGASLFLSVVTIAEMDAGILKLRREAKPERADELARLVATILGGFGERVLPIDIETARHVARLGEQTHRQPVALPDLIIAATAVRHGLILLTHNMSEIGRLGIDARDPFVDLPPDG